jgi:hypothetical protein
MKKVLLLALLALALPVATWANSTQIVFQNNGGKMSTNGITLSLNGSTLTSFNALGGSTYTGNLGTVKFTTGTLNSGTLGTSASFNAGGSFTIAGNGNNGIPNGVLFTGSFAGPANWVGTYNPAGNGGLGNWTYTLEGTIHGTLSNGTAAFGGTVQFSFDVPGSREFGRGQTVRLNSGVTTVTVPEPGTLGLFGTGLIGLAGLIRRKLTS